MSYKFDTDGNILVPLSIRQIEIVKMALVTKTFQLRSKHAPVSQINEIIPLLVMVDDALVAGTKALSKSKPTEPKPVRKNGFWTSVQNLFDPPFTIEDFEAAQTLSGEKHFLDSMNFDGSRTSCPSSVEGMIFHDGRWFKAEWDSHGQCTCIGVTPEEVARFHLAVFNRSKTNSKKSLVFTVLISLLALIFLSIIQ